jgi:hypothetical protein
MDPIGLFTGCFLELAPGFMALAAFSAMSTTVAEASWFTSDGNVAFTRSDVSVPFTHTMGGLGMIAGAV